MPLLHLSETQHISQLMQIVIPRLLLWKMCSLIHDCNFYAHYAYLEKDCLQFLCFAVLHDKLIRCQILRCVEYL